MTENKDKFIDAADEELDEDKLKDLLDNLPEVEVTDAKPQGGLKNGTMPLIPLRGLIVFPQTVINFDVGREKSVLALQRAMVMNQTVFLTSQKNADTDLPTPDDFYTVGTVAKIKQMLKMPGDNIRVLVEGLYRAQITGIIQEVPYFLCSCAELPETTPLEKGASLIALMRTAKSLYADYIRRSQSKPELGDSVKDIKEPGRLADVIASNVELKIEDTQKLLITLDAPERLQILVDMLSKELEILSLEDKINSQVRDKMMQDQKEYYLREQMRVIADELGHGENVQEDAESYRDKIKELHLPEVVEKKLLKEVANLERMPANSPEVNVSRTYIEWCLELPWNKKTDVQVKLSEAQRVLDEDHYGLEKVKERILELLAVRALSDSEKGSILCLVGPPGVGKTSVVRSVARSIGREFVHMSLGGVRDEAEIRGHRRTYIGAIPGRIMSAIKECGVSNPVFLFDEVDKIGADYKGDPADALLEVLDPEQNKEFVDHYLEIPFDLSGVMFITTANTTETIPRPLLDRMEVIEIAGYTPDEKFNIGKDYLIPKQIKSHGLEAYHVSFEDEAVRQIIEHYTREAGVRGLEKQIAKVCRRLARHVVDSDFNKRKRYTISAKKLESYLGKEKYHYDKLLGKNEVGVATGLAWTMVGGETLFIETAVMTGSGQLVLTGQLGDVMQESAKAAVSYIRTRAKDLGIAEDFHKTKDIHVHIPEGAVPKDGPSAGVTMCISVISALSGRAVRKDVAMTGEITLRGKIMPVGGIKEKMLAAHRMGITKVLLPEDNLIDLEELPQAVRESMKFVALKTVDDAIKEALV
ncbi:MAG: endopeptidase La [Clostridia bacterium]|nr:endopeptidase La [Clostridia bacterium]